MKPRGRRPVEPRVRAEGQIRQSQLITTYGPGAMVDLVEHAVLVGGTDFWSYDARRPAVISEPRLRESLAEKFRQAGRKLSVDAPFRHPPATDEREISRARGVPVLEFPSWFVCQSPDCRALVHSRHTQLAGSRHVHECRTRRSECVPVRFVAACPRGHLEDFPWIAFAHSRGRICDAPSLWLEEGPSGDFTEIHVRCACGQGESLLRATAPDGVASCHGQRPWLGKEGNEDCDERLRLLVRTASNSYFAQVVSVLSIDAGDHLEEDLRRVWDVMQSVTPETLPAFRTIEKVKAAVGAASDAEILAVVEAIRADAPAEHEPLRTAEFNHFLRQEDEAPGELPKPSDTFFARRCRPEGGLPAQVASLILAPRLREIRAQIGFTRIEPVTPDLQGEFDLGVESAPLGLNSDWLPASEIRGEGVLIQLDEEAVREWERRAAVVERDSELAAGYDAWWDSTQRKRATPARKPPFPGTRFYLLHSLSHLLISAISLECGYAASAIRERIYCADADDPPMAAILLSTGTSGTEGTLGGLVEQGRRLRAHLRRAFDLGVLCSGDPVCAAHSPAGDHSERHLEGAACHGCLFIAECSCERFNRYLDRALVVPTIGHPAELAFFGARP